MYSRESPNISAHDLDNSKVNDVIKMLSKNNSLYSNFSSFDVEMEYSQNSPNEY